MKDEIIDKIDEQTGKIIANLPQRFELKTIFMNLDTYKELWRYYNSRKYYWGHGYKDKDMRIELITSCGVQLEVEINCNLIKNEFMYGIKLKESELNE